MRAGKPRPDQPFNQPTHRFAQIDGSRLGQRLQSGGEVDRIAERGRGGRAALNQTFQLSF